MDCRHQAYSIPPRADIWPVYWALRGGTAMSTTSVTRQSGTASVSAIWKDKILPSVLAAVLGSTIVFAMGFAETSVLHNAAHDGRHSAGFPCH